jgi:hypothetical protein
VCQLPENEPLITVSEALGAAVTIVKLASCAVVMIYSVGNLYTSCPEVKNREHTANNQTANAEKRAWDAFIIMAQPDIMKRYDRTNLRVHLRVCPIQLPRKTSSLNAVLRGKRCAHAAESDLGELGPITLL